LLGVGNHNEQPSTATNIHPRQAATQAGRSHPITIGDQDRTMKTSGKDNDFRSYIL
jgi:hypothetical protein